jgi:hypothetical protein
MLCELFSFEYTLGGYIMAGLTMMLFEKGPENNIRCRTINGGSKEIHMCLRYFIIKIL